jgi:hypothetical protein
MNVVDQGVELVVGLVLMKGADEAQVDRRMPTVGNDRE